MTPLETALLAAVVAGALVVLWLLRDRYRLTAQRDLARQRLADLQEGEARLRESFRSLATETMQANSAQFLQLAERTLAARESRAVAEMDKRRTAVDQLVKPIEQALKRTEGELRRLERERVKAYAGLKTQVKGIAASNAELSRETGKLARALGRPTVRGRYGEIQLKRVAELAGMQEYCDFATQEGVRDEHGKLVRPDMVVRLPNGRLIAVDAKTSLDDYVEALSARSPQDQKKRLARFADHVARQAHELSRRGYWKHFPHSPEFVVMFIPGDQFVDAALEQRPDLIEICAKKNVVLASPSTLIGLLRAVHVGWHEKRLSDSAQELFGLGRELHERATLALSHAEKLGASLEQALRRYNSFVASVDTRLIPTLRKFEDRGVRAGEPVHELRPVEGDVRLPRSAEDESDRADELAPRRAE